MRLKKLHIVSIICLFALSSYGQNNNVHKAVQLYQAQKLDSAAYYIDLAAENAETKEKASTYYYRGIIHKQLHTANKSDYFSRNRIQALESFRTFLSLNTDEKLNGPVQKNIENIVKSVYIDAANTLNNKDYKTSLKLFEQYKQLHKEYELSDDITGIERQYNLVLGQIYSELYDELRVENPNNEFFEKVIKLYEGVLANDPGNWNANYNLGIHYYNEAVNRIKVADFDIDIVAVGLVQDEAVHLFEKALPYMTKAHDLKPSRKEPIIGLSGIYFSLNEVDRSEEFEKKAKEIEELENK